MNVNARTLRLTLDEINVDNDGQSIATLVHDDGRLLTVPLELLPEDAQVNQVIEAVFQLDPDASDDRKRRVRNLQHRLFTRESGPR